MSIATKTGDDGTTALMFGRRVPKTDLRIAACGACDELNSALGMCRAFSSDPFLTDPILTIQRELITVMGEIGLLAEDRERYQAKGFRVVVAPMVDALSARIDNLEQNHQLNFSNWATPGGSRESALFDVARSTCRRAERAVVALAETAPVNPEIIRYLNRLSDLCWLYARYAETTVE